MASPHDARKDSQNELERARTRTRTIACITTPEMTRTLGRQAIIQNRSFLDITTQRMGRRLRSIPVFDH